MYVISDMRIIKYRKKVEIPADLIWDLFNFTSVPTIGRQIMDRHDDREKVSSCWLHVIFQSRINMSLCDGISKITVREG